MEDPKKFLSPSSPNFSPSGNNENVSEFKRNSEQTNKKLFMAPTISTASKNITPNKKKILAEWKPPKKGTIHKSNPKNSDTKIPSFSEDDESFVLDSSANSTTTLPYDPLANYLSPRPIFLRYNPNRKRKIVFRKELESSSSSSSSSSCSTVIVSPKRNSLDCESSCKLVETEENLDQELEEEVEEKEIGWKWVLFNWVFVISGLIFSTMYISSMNNSAAIYSGNVEFQDFGNLTSGIVALRDLRSINSGGHWVSEFDAESEISGEILGRFEENQVPFKPEEENLNVEFNSEIDYSDNIGVFEGFHQNIKDFDVISTEKIEENEPLKPEEENLNVEFNSEIDYSEKIGVFEGFHQKIKEFDGVLTEEIGENEPFKPEEENLDVEFSSELDYSENFRALRSFPKVKDFVGVFSEKNVENEDNNVAESKNEVKNLVSDASIAVLEPQLVDLEEKIHDLAENKVEIVDDNHEIDDQNEMKLTQMKFIWMVGLAWLVVVGLTVLVCFRKKCKKAFTKATASYRVRNSAAVNEGGINFRPECQINNYLTVGVDESRVERKKSPPPRRIPEVKQLGEIEFGGEFSGRMQKREESVFAVTDERRAKKSKVSSSASESANKEDVKEEGTGTALRRSQRLRAAKGIASP